MADRPLTETAICNLALGLLKQKQISSIETPVSPNEIQCAQWYHQVRRAVLADHIWNFARTRDELTRASDEPAFYFDSKFELPPDFLRLVQVGDEPGDEPEHEVEDGYIMVVGLEDETDTLPIIYVKDHTSVGEMTPHFIRLLTVELAIVLQPIMAGEFKDLESLLALRDRWAKKAFAVDGQESKPKVIYNSNMRTARGRVGTV